MAQDVGIVGFRCRDDSTWSPAPEGNHMEYVICFLRGLLPEESHRVISKGEWRWGESAQADLVAECLQARF